ncbi:leucine-rich repeat-containing protein 75A isoform X2 [Ovis aries]|uniref:leucine-rich repeat-containing protein 75A isoform X2 n=1 Tax=Ovis aries TaxID=9940 RepID=UPI001C2E1611|nr:leucine-rich repeat-containing protein 75A isoform X2 [Ovis aries]
MGTRQTKGSLAERAGPGAAPGPRRERPDFWASLLLRAGDKAGRAGAGAGLPPYHRRVGMVQELLRMLRQGRREEAGTLLQHLRQDLGMESTSLDDVLYRYASFRNLVDPITHDLIISLARYIHCPKPEGDALGAMEKLCRQLTYHLSPHSQWRRHRGLVKRKPQAWVPFLLAHRHAEFQQPQGLCTCGPSAGTPSKFLPRPGSFSYEANRKSKLQSGAPPPRCPSQGWSFGFTWVPGDQIWVWSKKSKRQGRRARDGGGGEWKQVESSPTRLRAPAPTPNPCLLS